jgi:hypothetical protein
MGVEFDEDVRLDPEAAGRGALQDVQDILDADALIGFTDGHYIKFIGGARHTELGIAIARSKRIFLVGEIEQVFHCMPLIQHFRDWEDFVARSGLISAVNPVVEFVADNPELTCAQCVLEYKKTHGPAAQAFLEAMDSRKIVVTDDYRYVVRGDA